MCAQLLYLQMSIEDDLKTTKRLAPEAKTMINIVFTASVISNKFTLLLKPFGISMQQYNVLRILRGQKKKSISLADVQARMINKMSNTTRLIDKLKEKGYVTRVLNDSNRRKISLNITARGMDLLSKTDPLVEKKGINITDNLSFEELNVLNELLEKIRTE